MCLGAGTPISSMELFNCSLYITSGWMLCLCSGMFCWAAEVTIGTSSSSASSTDFTVASVKSGIHFPQCLWKVQRRLMVHNYRDLAASSWEISQRKQNLIEPQCRWRRIVHSIFCVVLKPVPIGVRRRLLWKKIGFLEVFLDQISNGNNSLAGRHRDRHIISDNVVNLLRDCYMPVCSNYAKNYASIKGLFIGWTPNNQH